MEVQGEEGRFEIWMVQSLQPKEKSRLQRVPFLPGGEGGEGGDAVIGGL